MHLLLAGGLIAATAAYRAKGAALRTTAGIISGLVLLSSLCFWGQW